MVASASHRWLERLPLLLERSGVDPEYVRLYDDPPAAQLPAGAAEYLVADNPRLAELATGAAAAAVGVPHTRWNNDYIQREIPLTRFRADCGYVWQHRDLNLPVTYLLTYHYLRSLPDGAAVLADATEDDLFGVYYVREGDELLTRDRLDAVCEILFLKHWLNLDRTSRAHVLDIGGGYGRLAHRLAQHCPAVQVTCVDAIAVSTFLCEYYLAVRGVQDRARAISVGQAADYCSSGDILVATNIHSFSECPIEWIRWWLAFLRARAVPYLFVVPNPGTTGGRRLLSTEHDGRRCDFYEVIVEHGYRLVVRAPKYATAGMQRFGVTPTYHYLFEFCG